MKKAVSLLLLLATFAQLASCGSETTASDDTTTAADTTETTVAEDPRLSIDDGLPETDLNGFELRMLALYEADNEFLALDESTGDVVNDAVYDRNARISERFNCTFSVKNVPGQTKWQDFNNYVKTSVLADSDELDLLFGHSVGSAVMSLEGVLTNLYDLPYQDFSKPWWSEEFVEECSLLDQMYIVGDAVGLGTISGCQVLFFNKKAFDEYKLEYPYESVFDGSWTFDKMQSLVKDVYRDLNGNSQRDKNDFYGWASVASCRYLSMAFDIKTVDKDPEKGLMITKNMSRATEFIEKLYSFAYENTGFYVPAKKDPETGEAPLLVSQKMFANGQTLFVPCGLSAAAGTFRESSVEYGIIPYPKYDADQENYRTPCPDARYISVPVTVSEPETVSLLLEAMAAETYKTVVPAYYNTALKDKFTYDSESGKALDIITQSIVTQFDWLYDAWEGISGFTGALFDDAETPSKDFASYVAGRETAANKRYATVNEFFMEHAK